MNKDLEMEKAAMLIRARHAVKKVAVEFKTELRTRVGEIENALLKGEIEKVVELSYNLEGEAATFGWPRVTRMCKWLRQIFTGDYDQKPDAEDILKVINALKLMVTDPDNPNEERDEALFREIYPMMSRAVSDI
ncbi:Hpt domain-containing protein [Pseudemcibacter aquimaris]|uniref:Hpt domain-containing protein n=1 Tax=Pseudemcibacter aquimaris TaxID=2857064 RepID=UPI0020123679|nr:Hpt domain-containing protein [Pseudemcibacter aquimaris]MCC3861517.1 Hpt domain-containing protein [Pseudemcibacter aquimaris]WDU58286.1 Hpt domain-containing protein [Pseudemcibacter aquimaris]